MKKTELVKLIKEVISENSSAKDVVVNILTQSKNTLGYTKAIEKLCDRIKNQGEIKLTPNNVNLIIKEILSFTNDTIEEYLKGSIKYKNQN